MLNREPGQSPRYWQGLVQYPPVNPILVTREYQCLNIIHRFKGFCLFCAESPEVTDFSCCFLREVWVLYRNKRYLPDALQVAQAIQRSGASEITIIRLGLST